MKVIAITQARYGSSRLPGKVLEHANGKSLLQIHLERASKARRIDALIVATTFEEESKLIVDLVASLGFKCFRGSLNDVLDRFYQAAREFRPDYIVRLTSDCPLIDPGIIDSIVSECISGNYDYCSNTLHPTYPDGMDVEVFTFNALEKAWKEATLSSDREHVTPYIWRNSTERKVGPFVSHNFTNGQDYSNFRLTVDRREDLDLIRKLVSKLGDDKNWLEYVKFLETEPVLFDINAHNKRNEEFMQSSSIEKIVLRHITNFRKSDEFRSKIHDLIPGGAHTYSKGDDQFPQLSPAAIVKGSGSQVWDVDDNQFLDCSMGLTSVSLGHAYKEVVDEVSRELHNGVNFQRPSVLEKEIGEEFLSLVPQHDMIKIAKNGSIVTTAAVKLARAYTGRKLVAFPGDHPFYSYDDWFIGKTACNKGVPDEISNLSVTFKSCSIESLKELFSKYPGQIACVIMEPERSSNASEYSYGPKAAEYLQEAIDLTHKEGALFIIDEMITGFKTHFPGSIVKYKLDADMATWGKGIANGFSFCALTGKKNIMELGGIRNKGKEKVFLISTTHGAETHVLTAALATIDIFRKENVIAHNHKVGDAILEMCTQAIYEHSLQDYIEIIPCNWMLAFIFKNKKGEVCAGMRTLMMQEMIKRGVLFQGAFVPCFSHLREDVQYFSAALASSLSVYAKALNEGYESYLVGEPAKPVFRKYL